MCTLYCHTQLQPSKQYTDESFCCQAPSPYALLTYFTQTIISNNIRHESPGSSGGRAGHQFLCEESGQRERELVGVHPVIMMQGKAS